MWHFFSIFVRPQSGCPGAVKSEPMEKQMPEVFQEAKYDVFISYSRKDYVDENNVPIPDSPVAELIDFFKSHGIKYWIDKKGIGASPSFAREIREAIKDSKMLIFVSSEHSNKSKWTYREISFADKKDKCVLTIRIDDAEYNEDIEMYLQGGQPCDYFSTPSESLDFLLSAINIEKKNYEKKVEEAKRKMAEKEENERKERLREEIDSDKEKYNSQASELKKDSERIIRKLKEIGEDHKKCPICESNVPLSDLFCKTCGWTFVPPFETSPVVDEKHRKKALEIWKDAQLTAGAQKEISSLREQIDGDRKRQDETAARISQLESDNSDLEAKVTSYRGKISQHGKQEAVLKEKISELEEKLKQAMISPNNSGHGYVDLGLPSGTLWATCNVGASKPSDYGDYFAWGETSPKKDYDWSNLKYCNDSTGDSFSKYNKNQAGTKDNKSVLELMDDAARSNWGGSWRMPTEEEWVELKNNCIWTWTSQGGHKGYKVTGRNCKSIFLPAAGWRSGDSQYDVGVGGEYWSSSLHTGESYYAFYCYFTSDGVSPSDWYSRCVGLSVRPVVSSLH